MLFNSVDYLIFFPVVVALYFALPVKWRWLLLLIASYFFYMWWKVEYVILIMVTTIIDYFVALKISSAATKQHKKRWLVLSVLVNLGMLAGFKYLNFLSGSMNWLFSELNVSQSFPILDVLLPVGISFYIFQSISYLADIHLPCFDNDGDVVDQYGCRDVFAVRPERRLHRLAIHADAGI